MANSITTLINISQDSDRSITDSSQIEDGKTYLLYMVDSDGGSKRDKAVTLDALTDHMVEETDYRVKTSSSDENPDYLAAKMNQADTGDGGHGDIKFGAATLESETEGIEGEVQHLGDVNLTGAISGAGSISITGDAEAANVTVTKGGTLTASKANGAYVKQTEVDGEIELTNTADSNVSNTITASSVTITSGEDTTAITSSQVAIKDTSDDNGAFLTAENLTFNDSLSGTTLTAAATMNSGGLTASSYEYDSDAGAPESTSVMTLTSEGLTAAYTQDATDDEAFHGYEASMTYESLSLGDTTTNGKSSSSLTASELTLAGSDSTATIITKGDITIIDNTSSNSYYSMTLTANTIQANYSSSGGGRATTITPNSIYMTDSNGVEVTLTDGTGTCTITQETIKVASAAAYALIDPSQLLLTSSGSTNAKVQNSGLFTSNYSSTKYWAFRNNNFLSLTEDSDALLTYDVVTGGLVFVANTGSSSIAVTVYDETDGTTYEHTVSRRHAAAFLCVGQTTDGYPIFKILG